MGDVSVFSFSFIYFELRKNLSRFNIIVDTFYSIFVIFVIFVVRKRIKKVFGNVN